MPVHLDDHDPGIDLTPGTTKSDIVVFLYEQPELGFKPAEIKDELEIPRGTATTTLKRLYDEGYIGKTLDGYYHARSDREDIRRYVANLDQANRLFNHHEGRTDGISGSAGTDEQRTEPSDAALEAELDQLEEELDAQHD